jgi:gliding motility-associated-like protein
MKTSKLKLNKNLFYSISLLFTTLSVFAAPVNDDPCNATPLTVNGVCNSQNFTTVGATASSIADPSCAGSSFLDVWFTVVVPANGTLIIDSQAGSMSDSGMAWYTGPDCSTLSEIYCDDDGGTSSTLMSMISSNTLTPGAIIYVRFWRYTGTGTFGICASTPPPMPQCGSNPLASDNCNNAPSICNIDGYCGNTSASYTATSGWSQMTSVFCSGLQNDSYIKFVADSTAIAFYVWQTSSQNGDGIQMMVYSSTNCGSGAVTDYGCFGQISPSNNPSLVTATGLTPGQTYYIIIDGYAGDVCNYVIGLPQGSGGIALPANITPAVSNICLGQSVNLTASGGSGTFDWTSSPNVSELNSTTASNVIATPTTIGTSVYVITTTSGPAACPNSNTDSAFVYVMSTPSAGNGITDTICALSSSTVSGATSNGGVTWTIQSGAGTLTNTNTLTPTYNSVIADEGNHVILDMTVTGCGGTAISHDTIYVLPRLYANINGNFSYCPNQGTTMLSLPDSSLLDSAEWKLNGNIIRTGFTANLTVGTYNVTVYGIGSLCTKDTTITITYTLSPVQLVYTGGVDCNDSSVVLNQNIGGPLGQWTCINNSGVTFTPPNNISTTVHVPSYGDYQFVFTEPVCNEDDTVTIKFRPDQYVDLFTELKICSGSEQEIQSFPFPDYAQYITNYIWTKQGNSTVISDNTSINVTEAGYYICTVTGECASFSDSTLIIVKDCDLQIPNTFTPNGDGENDFFKLLTDDLDFFKTFNISIVNRWGNIVAEFSIPDFKWDGKDKNGNLVENGVYFYNINSTTIEETELKKQGFIQVFTDK